MTQQVLSISALRSHVHNADGYPKITVITFAMRKPLTVLTSNHLPTSKPN